MKHLFFILIVLSSTVCCTAQKTAWQSLFNGKDLTGWQVKSTPADQDKAYWTVTKGMIVCNSIGSPHHDYIWLQSDTEYEDFEVVFNFRVWRDHQGNSGFQFHSRYDQQANEGISKGGWMDGPQADINVKGGSWRCGLIYDETRTMNRWVSPDLPSYGIKVKDVLIKKVPLRFADEGNGWNTMRIRCQSNYITTYVNGKKITSYDGNGILTDSAHKRLHVANKGHFAIQLHRKAQNHLAFKNIRVRSL